LKNAALGMGYMRSSKVGLCQNVVRNSTFQLMAGKETGCIRRLGWLNGTGGQPDEWRLQYKAETITLCGLGHRVSSGVQAVLLGN